MIHFQTLDSTIPWAKAHAGELDPKKLTCISASVQTAGKGRRGHDWVSSEGNIHISLFFHLDKGDPRIPNLAQTASLSVAKMLKKENISAQLKWPNDIIFSEKKLAGFLAETFEVGSHYAALVSVGLNANTPVETDQETTSLFEITGKKWDLARLRSKIASSFLEEYSLGFSHEDFEQFLAFKGEAITFTLDGKIFEGTLLGLAETGQLKLELPSGEVALFSSGEISKLRSI